MAVQDIPVNSRLWSQGYRYLALTGDTISTTGAMVGDRAKITDGPDKLFDGSAWAAETAETLGSVGVTSLPTQGFSVQTTITRPANQTPYTAMDVVGGAQDLGVLGSSGQTIQIVSAQLELDISAIPAGMSSFSLALYSVTPPSATADNGAWDLPSGDRASFLGLLPLGSPADLGSTCYCEVFDVWKQVKLAGTHLFGYPITIGGFTPAANSEVYKVSLHTVNI